MASPEQIAANRRNAQKSTGPKDTSKTRFNGLKHGLCGRHVHLPGESEEEFQAEHSGWAGDWGPLTHTRAVLVELAAVATVQVRRAIRSASAHYARLAERAAAAFDAERLAHVERVVDRLEDDPAGGIALLESDPLGIDRLTRAWGEIVEALERGPAAWRERRWHTRLMLLLGHPRGTAATSAGPLEAASVRLMMSGTAGAAPLPAGEAEATVEALRRLRELRRHAPDLSAGRRRAIDAASAGDLSDEARLRRRYEAEHRNALKWALRQLMALKKSWIDLADDPEPESEAGSAPGAAPEPAAAAPAAPGNKDANHYKVYIYEELASVRESPPRDEHPTASRTTAAGPGGPPGADRGPKEPANRS